MALKLKENESIELEVQLHWSAFLIPGLWALLCTPGLIGSFFSNESSLAISLWILFLGYFPLAYVFLKNKTKRYLVTNQRMHVEEGILAKNRRDIPLNKINDFTVRQGLIQRMFGAGDVHVMTGNSVPTILSHVADSEAFREKASELLNRQSATKPELVERAT